MTKFLKEGEEVGGVIGGHDVAPDTVLVRILPVKVDTTQIVGVDKFDDGLDEIGAVLGGGDC